MTEGKLRQGAKVDKAKYKGKVLYNGGIVLQFIHQSDTNNLHNKLHH